MEPSALLLTAFMMSRVSATVYMEEKFDDGDAWKSRWVESKYKKDLGKFNLSVGRWSNDPVADVGLMTTEDNHHYAISRKFDKVFNGRNKTLILQFSVRHEEKVSCGGSYVKLFSDKIDLNTFGSDTPYYIMFGPDQCGSSNTLIQLIFNYHDIYLERKNDIKYYADESTHVFTLIIHPDLTYVVLKDNIPESRGTLEKDWDFLPPKEIPDPKAIKPADWDDREMIDDPNDVKPDDWDQPELITDSTAEKPVDWDDEIHGTWAAPKTANPDYKGEWKPKQIKNPRYKGVWRPPMIKNPEYEIDPNLGVYEDIGAIGFDLWQVTSGSLFDNILVTDDENYATTAFERIASGLQEFEKKKVEEKRAEEEKRLQNISEENMKKDEIRVNEEKEKRRKQIQEALKKKREELKKKKIENEL